MARVKSAVDKAVEVVESVTEAVKAVETVVEEVVSYIGGEVTTSVLINNVLVEFEKGVATVTTEIAEALRAATLIK